MTTRHVTIPMAPVGAYCKLCKLHVDDGDLLLNVIYVADRGKDAAINRRCWICSECALAIDGQLAELRGMKDSP
jgi:hypothetical protein